MTAPLKAPFPWFGGKRRVAPIVWERFGDVPNYVEPFAGSLAVLLGRPTPPKIETVNDIDRFIANFWRAITADPEAVAKWADWPVNECVPAGTMIATPNGPVPVEHIHTGMQIWGEQDGHRVVTTILATKISWASDFYGIGPLLLTGNHPVWTRELGYIDAMAVTSGLHVKIFNQGVDENDLRMACSQHEQQALGNLHAERPPNQSSAIRRRDIPGKGPVQRAHIESSQRRKNAQRLLGSIPRLSIRPTGLFRYRGRLRKWLAGPRASLDRQIPIDYKPDELHGRGRGISGLCSNRGTAGEMVRDADWEKVSAGAILGNAGSETFSGNAAKDQRGRSRPQAKHGNQGPNIRRRQTAGRFPFDYRSLSSSTTGKETQCRTQPQDCGGGDKPQTCSVHRDGTNLRVYHLDRSSFGRQRGIGLSGDPQGLSLRRVSLPACVAVYNFQTDTGNYFADDILVHNCDLHARHRWLQDQAAFRERIHADPDFYDAKIAGWWVWGICAWIGPGWCANNDRKLPHLSSGRGVHRPTVTVIDWFAELADRLRRVRVACGDWTRVTGPSVTVKHGLTGVFLDPPYDHSGRDNNIYAHEMECAASVREWAIANGDNPLMRIALCGYTGEHDMPADWDAVPWKADGGYGNQSSGGRGRANSGREVIWFSPHCLRPEDLFNQPLTASGKIKPFRKETGNIE